MFIDFVLIFLLDGPVFLPSIPIVRRARRLEIFKIFCCLVPLRPPLKSALQIPPRLMFIMPFPLGSGQNHCDIDGLLHARLCRR